MIRIVATCWGNRNRLWLGGPLGARTDFSFYYDCSFFKLGIFLKFLSSFGFFVFKGRGSPRIPSRYHPSIVPMHLQIQSVLFFCSCLHTKGCCCCSGFFWPGRHAMSLYLLWMTQNTSECWFLTCSCCPSSMPLTLEGSEYYNASMPFYPYAWSWILLWRCCWFLLQRWEFHGWKPIIYTCDYRGVWLNCISWIHHTLSKSVSNFWLYRSYLP